MSRSAEEMERRRRERETQEYQESQSSKLPPIPTPTDGNMLEVVSSLVQRERARSGELRGFRSDAARNTAIIDGRIGDQVARSQDVSAVPAPAGAMVRVAPLLGIFVTWGATRFQTQIYRTTTDEPPGFNSPATAQVSGSVFLDNDFMVGMDRYYYWVRHVHVNSDGALVGSGWVLAGNGQPEDQIETDDIMPEAVTIPNTLESLSTMSSGWEVPNWVETGGSLRLETTEFHFDVDLTYDSDDWSNLNAILFNLDYSVLARQQGQGVTDTQLVLSSDIELRVRAELMYEGEVLFGITPGNGLVASAGLLVGSSEEETYQSLVYPVGAKLFRLPEVSNLSPELMIRFSCTITSAATTQIPLNSEQARNEFMFEFTKGADMWYLGLRR